MPYENYSNLIPSDKLEFIRKIYTELNVNATSIANNTYNYGSETPYKEFEKDIFLSLVNERNEFLENEKRYCKERFLYYYELTNVTDKQGKPRECSKCGLIRYSDKYCENCISLHLQELFNSWTSGNDVIDSFIQQCQK